MATFRVTPEALAHIRSEIEKYSMQAPFIGVSWQRQQADLLRTSEGETAWKYEQPRWVAGVLDLEDVGAWPGTLVEKHVLRFSLRGKPESPTLDGCLLDVQRGELYVREDAI